MNCLPDLQKDRFYSVKPNRDEDVIAHIERWAAPGSGRRFFAVGFTYGKAPAADNDPPHYEEQVTAREVWRVNCRLTLRV
jgi:hypothetical protein